MTTDLNYRIVTLARIAALSMVLAVPTASNAFAQYTAFGAQQDDAIRNAARASHGMANAPVPQATAERDTSGTEGITPSGATPGHRPIPVDPNARSVVPESGTVGGGSATPVHGPEGQ